ncbi:FixH family protein [Filobacillus milosensis]|nr:FixH family protein [Filobacillus milosensis]
MKKLFFFLLIGLLTLLVACGDDEGQSSDNKEDENKEGEMNHEDMENDSLTPVEVEVLTEDQVSLSEVTLEAKVTHGGEPVEEADEVMFEVWKKGDKENSKKVEGTYTEDGIYEASFNFEEAGTYEMYAHVTAVSQHVMPKHEFEVKE